MLKKAVMIVAFVILTLGTWAVIADNNGGEAFEYFPLKAKNIWSYKASLPNNEAFSQQVMVTDQVGQNIKTVIFVNKTPWMEVSYLLNEQGLFRTKQISAEGVTTLEPKQMVLASKLVPGMSWNWETDDKKEKETAKVIGIEKVTVPAGTFEALLVQYEGNYKDGATYLEKTWFVKGVGYVKSILSTADQSIIKELLEYKIN